MTKDRWFRLMQSIGLPQSEECFDSLHAAYSERHRHYHSVSHIKAMLHHLDSVLSLVEHPQEVELAIWFHDAIYKPLSSTNEADSASWCKKFLAQNQYDGAKINLINDLIMATLHNHEVNKNDEMLLVDIDLSILGSPAEVYDEFEKNIRKEYSIVPSFIFRKKRKKLLQAFIDRDSIFNHEHFKIKYEQLARDNMCRAIGSL